MHDRGIQFQSLDQIAEFVDGRGVTKEEFIAAFNSPEVRRAMREADVAQRTIPIMSVPTLIVAERYEINMDSGRKAALAIADHLIAEELARADVAR